MNPKQRPRFGALFVAACRPMTWGPEQLPRLVQGFLVRILGIRDTILGVPNYDFTVLEL